MIHALTHTHTDLTLKVLDVPKCCMQTLLLWPCVVDKAYPSKISYMHISACRLECYSERCILEKLFKKLFILIAFDGVHPGIFDFSLLTKYSELDYDNFLRFNRLLAFARGCDIYS
ncbi:hypothetical protein YC2023_041484 [Brassica napus]